MPANFNETLATVFKLVDWLNLYVNFFVIINVAIVGWLFSAKKPWSNNQKRVVATLYVIAVSVNLLAVYETGRLLEIALSELRLAATTYQSTQAYKDAVQGIPLAARIISVPLHLITDGLVLYLILGNILKHDEEGKLTGEEKNI